MSASVLLVDPKYENARSEAYRGRRRELLRQEGLVAWDQRYGMVTGKKDIEAGRLALGLYPRELEALAEHALAQAAWWDTAEVDSNEEYAAFWRRRAQRWQQMAAEKEGTKIKFGRVPDKKSRE